MFSVEWNTLYTANFVVRCRGSGGGVGEKPSRLKCKFDVLLKDPAHPLHGLGGGGGGGGAGAA